jgi:P4 family phage/plasmid primase-like protien
MTNKSLINNTTSLNSSFVKNYYGKLERIDETLPFYVAYEYAFTDDEGSVDTTYRYKSYESYENFYETIKNEKPENMRWYEIMKENNPVVECYDLDAKLNDKNERNNLMFKRYLEIGEDAMIDEFKYHRKRFIETHYPLYDEKETFAISTSCSNDKFSAHITVRNGFYFQDVSKLKIMMIEFDNYIKDHKFVLDLSIYSRNRCMRMLNNTKYGQKRFLKRHRYSSGLDEKDFLFSYVKPDDKLFEIKSKSCDTKVFKKKENSYDTSKDYEKMTQLLNLINSDCNQSKWSVIGQVIYNITNGSDDGMEQFIEWSQKDGYPDFNENKCIQTWNSYKQNDSYGIGNLVNRAREDSPEEYAELTKKNDFYSPKIVFVDDEIIECAEKIVNDCTHNNLAKIYAEYSKGEIFFTSGYGWIIFNKETKIWTYNNDKISLIYPISSFFCHIMKEYCDYFFKKDNKIEMTKKEEEEFINKTKSLMKMKREVGNSGFIKGIIEQIQSLLTKDNTFIDNFDNKPNLFAFSDGKCIDLLKNGEMRDIVKEDFIMTTCGYPYPKRDEIYIEKWNTIINSLSNDPEQLKSIKSLMSLSLWGENKNEIFAQLTGSGGNGKGLLDTGMKTVYGKYYQSISASQLTEYEKDTQRANPELASCRFARLVMASEPQDSGSNGKSTTLKVPTLKKWTGRDIISTRFLHKDTFSFTAKFILMMQLNDLLDLSINDEAIKRRMKVVELPFKFVINDGRTLAENEKYRDETLKDTISQEKYRDALFYILLNTWLENKGIFYESKRVKEFTNEFFENQNPVKLWFDEHYENDDSGRITATDMFNSFKNDNYESILNTTSFGRLLKECCKSKRGKSGIFFLCKKKSAEHPLYL